MAFPDGLDKYKSEDDFIQRFLIPLLKRMGFSVVNYHGTTEHGRDLIVAEMDRFGHIRYHGLQAKYESSIGLEDMKSVIDDCEQAFTTPFRHPQNGASEYISTFYAVNGGGIPDASRDRYFNCLKPRHGDNAKLLDGKALLVLDRWAAINRQQFIGETLEALRREIVANRQKMQELRPIYESMVRRENPRPPTSRLRHFASSAYLARPVALDRISYDQVGVYCDLSQLHNRWLDVAGGDPHHSAWVARQIFSDLQQWEDVAEEIEVAVIAALIELGPIAAL